MKNKIEIKSVLKIVLPILISFGLSFSTVNALAQDQNEDVELEAITCWEVMLLEEEDRAYALVLLYGYNAGKMNKAMTNGSMIEASITQALSYCGDNPDSPAIQAIALSSQ